MLQINKNAEKSVIIEKLQVKNINKCKEGLIKI